MERDLFDLYLIPKSLKVDADSVVDKIESSSLIKKQLKNIIESRLLELNTNKFFTSTQKISDLAILKYNLKDFEIFKDKIKPILIKICKEFLLKHKNQTIK